MVKDGRKENEGESPSKTVSRSTEKQSCAKREGWKKGQKWKRRLLC